LEALTFRLRGLEESSVLITKAETQQTIGIEVLDIRDKKCSESKNDEKENQQLKPYQRYCI
jgi:hypothetical protein